MATAQAARAQRRSRPRQIQPPEPIHQRRMPEPHTLYCLNCGRTLALLAGCEAGRQLLAPAHSGVPRLVRTEHGWRCAVCGGFPYLSE